MPSDVYELEDLDARECVCRHCNLVIWRASKFMHLLNDCTGRK